MFVSRRKKKKKKKKRGLDFFKKNNIYKYIYIYIYIYICRDTFLTPKLKVERNVGSTSPIQ